MLDAGLTENKIKLYTIDAIDLAEQIGMGKRTNTILQSAFFTLAKVMPQEEAIAMAIIVDKTFLMITSSTR